MQTVWRHGTLLRGSHPESLLRESLLRVLRVFLLRESMLRVSLRVSLLQSRMLRGSISSGDWNRLLLLVWLPVGRVVWLLLIRVGFGAHGRSRGF